MRFHSALLIGSALLGAQARLTDLKPRDAAVTAAAIFGRQNDGSGDAGASDGANSDNSAADPTTSDPPSSTSDSGSDPSSDSSSSSESSSEGGGGDATTSDGGSEDTTVTQTVTVTDDNVDTVTKQSTVTSKSTFTVVVISTVFDTTTVTSRDQATATKTVYETSTVFESATKSKRDLSVETEAVVARVRAVPTVDAAPSATGIDWGSLGQLEARDNVFDKRATVTDKVTVTVGEDSEATVTNVKTKKVVTTKSEVRTTTKMVTETEQADAKTTVTETSTLTVTSTGVGSVETSTSGGSVDKSNDGSSGGDSSGLSTGAKAGIGVGAGVGGLILLGALAFCIRRARKSKDKPEFDNFGGASEFPVGAAATAPSSSGAGNPPMSEYDSTRHGAAAGLLSPHGRAPPTQKSPEGYRGTAMGDGRAGYAKPAPYGAAYAAPSSTSPTNRSSTLHSQTPFTPSSAGGADSLPSHPAPNDANAAEMGHAGGYHHHAPGATEMDAAGVGHTSNAPPQNVYEMPSESYR